MKEEVENNDLSSNHDDDVIKKHNFKREEFDEDSESMQDPLHETVAKVEVKSELVEDAGTSLTRAVNSLNKCEVLLMSVSEDANDKDLVAFMCKIKNVKVNLDNLLTEFTRIWPSSLNTINTIKEEEMFPHIMLDLVKTEIEEDYEEYDSKITDADFLAPSMRAKGKSKLIKSEIGGKTGNRKHCEVCEISFSTLEEYRNHRMGCKREKHLKCDYCEELFISKRTMRIHITKYHKSEIKHKCKVCNAEFPTPKELLAHKNQEKHFLDEEKVHCEKCNKALSNMKSYREHKRLYHSRNHKCDLCFIAFDASKELREHLREVHDVKAVHPCATCGEAFTSVVELHAHLKESNHSAFTCEVCSKAFNSEHTLKSHVKYMHSSSYTCDVCGEQCDGKVALKRHKREKHILVDNQYVCQECGFTTHSRTSFRVHGLRHGARTHKCEHCDRMFHRKKDMVVHNRVHTGERPYGCEVCGKAFAASYKLTRHKIIHTGERPFVCALCGKGFNQKNNLRVHMRSHVKLDRSSAPANYEIGMLKNDEPIDDDN